MSSIASAGHSRIPVYMGDRHKDPQVCVVDPGTCAIQKIACNMVPGGRMGDMGGSLLSVVTP